MTDLPRWQCHKQVSADRIVEVIEGASRTIEPDTWLLAGGGKIVVSAELAARAKMTTHDLGYYVRYDGDGYESWSPAAAFEDGYTRIAPPAPRKPRAHRDAQDKPRHRY